KKTPEPDKDVAAKRFAQLLHASAEGLGKAPGYTVEVTSRWKAEGTGEPRSGVNHYRLVVQRPGKVRVEVGPTESGKAELVCVSDGKTLTRLLTAKGLYTKAKAVDPLAELPRCALTAMSLQGSGLDILTRPDAVTYVLGQVARVEDRGAAAF